jgi:TRAP transporter TAXI family solute receptor
MRKIAVLLLILAPFYIGAAEPYQGVFRIGTASKVGTFYKSMDQVCQLMNRHNTTYCVPVVTNGSLHNLNLLVTGKLDFAVVKSDVVLALDRNGLNDRSLERIHNINVIARLHNMPLTVIGRADGPDVFDFDSLERNFINIGLEGSGERIATEELFRAMKVSIRDIPTTMFDSRRVVQAFCDGETDIVMELIAHPAIIYDRLINECDGKLLHISSDIVNSLSAVNPYVSPAKVYEGFYTGGEKSYDSYAVYALLIANDDIDEELQSFVQGSLNENMDELVQRLPEWIDMTLEDLRIDNPPVFMAHE